MTRFTASQFFVIWVRANKDFLFSSGEYHAEVVYFSGIKSKSFISSYPIHVKQSNHSSRRLFGVFSIPRTIVDYNIYKDDNRLFLSGYNHIKGIEEIIELNAIAKIKLTKNKRIALPHRFSLAYFIITKNHRTKILCSMVFALNYSSLFLDFSCLFLEKPYTKINMGAIMKSKRDANTIIMK